jgi:hypothetical protein
VSSGRHAIYIVGLRLFLALLHERIIERRIWEIIHVSGSREQKGVRLYGKFDYYLICIEKIVGICSVVI